MTKNGMGFKKAVKIYAESVKKDIINNRDENEIPLFVYTCNLKETGELRGHCNFTFGLTQYMASGPDIRDVVHADLVNFNDQINMFAQEKMVSLIEKWEDMIGEK